MRKTRYACFASAAAICFGAFVASTTGAAASTVCVSTNPQSGCLYTSIKSAVDNASAGDVINVQPGTYHEDVHITKPISLIGAGAANTIIDATDKSNGIFIDGGQPAYTGSAPAANTLFNVTVSGFTVENAKFEGILISNASDVIVRQNIVVGNDQNLSTKDGTCPDIPTFETSEGLDCGQGIHLTGVDHSTISDNDVEHNAGGILISDDTGPTDNNLIIGNNVANNPYDCGITLASHLAYNPNHNGPYPFGYGVYRNTIAENTSTGNGIAAGGGSGVGLFASAPNTQTYGNVVIKNRLTNNGHPGVSMHSHAPGQHLTDNMITENYISGNGGDLVDSTTGIELLGATPLSDTSGIVITRNVIKNESVGIAVSVATDSTVDVHLNDLSGNGLSTVGIENLVHSTGTVDATENWWGCSGGPGANGCSSTQGTNVLTTPFLSVPVQPGG